MGKKKQGDRIVNRKRFLEDDDATVVSRNRSKARKIHQQGEKVISQKISSRILKEAINQRKEIEDDNEENDINFPAFSAVLGEHKELDLEEDSDSNDYGAFFGQSDGEECGACTAC